MAVGQSNVVLFVSPPVEAGDAVTVAYTAPEGASDARLQDMSGNAAASFSGRHVTNATAAPRNSPATGRPAISGAPRVGQTLTVFTSGISDADGLTNATFAYQWLADGTAIGGATGSSHTLTSAERGKAITVTVTFTDDAGNAEALTSAATAAVAAAVRELGTIAGLVAGIDDVDGGSWSGR